MSENVSKHLALTGAARKQEVSAQEAEGRRLAALGYWAGQLGALEKPSDRVKRKRWPRKDTVGAARIVLTWGVAHRLYLARKRKGWSARRAAQAFGIGESGYRNYERTCLYGNDVSAPVSQVRTQSGNPWGVSVPRALLHKAARIYNCEYFEEAANANA